MIFDLPRKYFLSEVMRGSLRATPLVIADVGSAMGLDSRWQPVAEFLEVLSFEPDGRSDGDGKVFRTALGAEDAGEQTLYLAKLPAASSFFPHHPEMDRFAIREWLKPAGTARVSVTTLDTCLEGRRIDFLKIDTEGADLDVLRGATKALENVLAVQVEVSFAQRHVGAPGFAEVDGFLTDRAFRIHHLIPEHWLRENGAWGSNSQPQLIYADAIYLKEGELKDEDLPKWALLFQAFGLHDLALDRLPEAWHEPIRRSMRGHAAFFWLAGWRLTLATALLPVFWGRAWRKWKSLAAGIFRELYRLANRSGPKGGIFRGE